MGNTVISNISRFEIDTTAFSPLTSYIGDEVDGVSSILSARGPDKPRKDVPYQHAPLVEHTRPQWLET